MTEQSEPNGASWAAPQSPGQSVPPGMPMATAHLPPPPSSPPPSPLGHEAAGGTPAISGSNPTRRRWLIIASIVAVVTLGGVAALAITQFAGGSDSSAPCPGADGRSRQLRECLEKSVAFIETPMATGSAILLADGYVVTNAHVIDPYDTADVTFQGGEEFVDVPVIGVDAFADVALLGPLPVDRAGLTLDPIGDLDEAEESDVFLVGYPGGIESSSPEVTLSSGVLSRLRVDESFGLTYLQTDAAIAGGQSGGALVADDGTVLGLTGLGFADEFALALSADDVARAVERIRAGDGHERRTLPALDDADGADGPIDVTAEHPTTTIILPADTARRDVELRIESSEEIAISVYTYWGDPIGLNEAALADAQAQAEEFDDPTLADLPALEELAAGTFGFEVPSDEVILVSLARLDADATVDVSADVPFEVFDDTVEGEVVTVGTPLRHVVDGFTYEVVHTVELEAGDDIEIFARGGTSDVFFTLLEPGEEYDLYAEADADDGAGGLYDLDAHESYEIDISGTYRIVVGTFDGVVGGYELDVRRVE